MPMPHAMLTPMIGATRNAPRTRSAAGNTVPLASAISYPATNGSSKALSTLATMLSDRGSGTRATNTTLRSPLTP
ncbi:hypothetical protein OKW41_007487 [Paraburkholderia sp. UCT70]